MARNGFILAALAWGLGLTAARAEEPDEGAIRRRVEQVKGAEINGWRKIPWVASLLEARRLSQQEHKPVFLYSHEGNIDTGRC